MFSLVVCCKIHTPIKYCVATIGSFFSLHAANQFNKCPYTTPARSSPFLSAHFIIFFCIFDSWCKHLSSSASRGWPKEPKAGGWGSSGCVEGKKWQGFREGGITQWAGSPAGGGIDGYLNRPAERLRIRRYNGPEVGCHSVRRWYVVVAAVGGAGEPAGEVRSWATGWTTQKNTHAHTNTPAVIDWRRRGPLSRNLHLWQPFFFLIYFIGGSLTGCPTCHKNREWPVCGRATKIFHQVTGKKKRPSCWSEIYNIYTIMIEPNLALS